MPTSDKKRRILELVNRAQDVGGLSQAGLPDAEAIIRLRNRLRGHKFGSLEQILNLLKSEKLDHWYNNFLPTCRDDRPALLLPLRIETRIVKNELRIRFYPDDAMLNMHDPQLNKKEISAGKAYLAAAADASANGNTDAARDAWRTLSSNFGPSRAAWIAKTANEYAAIRGLQPQEGNWGAETTLGPLPDRMVIYLYNADGGLAHPPIHRNYLLPDLQIFGGGDEASLFNEASDWIHDYNAALGNGMAISIDVDALNFGTANKRQLSRIVVVGLKRQTPEESQEDLEALFNGHHYSDGLAFVRQGTATNNTSDEKAGYSSREDHEASYQVEVIGPPNWDTAAVDFRHNAHRLGVALGLGQRPEVFRHVYGATDRSEDCAAAMNAALWPASGGYFLRKMIPGVVDSQHLDDAHDHFAKYVRAAGPLPVLRIGRQPYGVLPVTRIDRAQDGAAGWAPSERDEPPSVDFDDGLHNVLAHLYTKWTGLLDDPARVPRIGASADPEQELLEILSMQPVCVDVAGRPMLDSNFALFAMAALRDKIFGSGTVFDYVTPRNSSKEWLRRWRDTWRSEVNRVVSLLASITGLPSHRLEQSPVAQLFGWWTTLEPGPLTYAQDDKPDEYLKALCAGDTRSPSNTLLHELLKRSLALESASGGDSRVRDAVCRLASSTVLDFLNNAQDADTIANTIRDDPSSGLGPPRAYGVRPSLARRILEERDRLPGKRFSSLAQIDAIYGVGKDTYHDIIHALKGPLVSADIDLLFRQSLDLFSHRLDAWFTSLATKRLESMRKRTETGVHIGAYGYLEDLDLSGASIESAGYIHTPSSAQTAAAAVLYSAYLTHEAASDGKHPFHLNLTSDRVNRAMRLLQGVREGQPLGALLGYQFERGLHLRSGVLDQYLDDFRAAFPIVANKLTEGAEGEAVEAMAARNVVDGAALARAWRATKEQDASPDVRKIRASLDTVLQLAGSTNGDEIKKELDRLLDSADAVGDTLMFESIYHAASENYEAAGAALDATTGKGHPPLISSLSTRGNASALDHRVVMLLPQSTVNDGASPRSLAEPTLAEWFAGNLSPLEQIGCSYGWRDSDGNEHAPTNSIVTLADLSISAIDFFYLSSLPLQGEETELEQRVHRIARARDSLQLEQRIELDLSKPNGFTGIGFDEAAEFARQTFALLSQAAVLDPAALAMPAEAQAAHYSIDDARSLWGRVRAARTALDNLRAELDRLLPEKSPDGIEPVLTDSERAAIDPVLLEISRFGVPGAVAPGTGDPGLFARARGVLNDVERRVRGAADINEPDPALASAALDDYVSSDCVTALKSLFGRAFIILPPFVPGGMASIRASMNDAELLGGTDEHRVRLWLQQEAEVHPALERLEDWLLISEAWSQTLTNPASNQLGIAQLPHEAGRRWLALADDERNGQERDRDALSIVMVGSDLPRLIGDSGSMSVAGFVIHRCQDRVPSADVHTSVGFHYDAPSAQAPQCLLLAVPPKIVDPPGKWTEDELEAIVRSAMDLAKIRTVDLDALCSPEAEGQSASTDAQSGLGALIPALIVPADPARTGPSQPVVAKAVDDWLGITSDTRAPG